MKTDDETLIRAMADEYGRAGAAGAPRLDRMRLALAVVRAHDAAAAALTDAPGGPACSGECNPHGSCCGCNECCRCGAPAGAPVAAPVPVVTPGVTKPPKFGGFLLDEKDRFKPDLLCKYCSWWPVARANEMCRKCHRRFVPRFAKLPDVPVPPVTPAPVPCSTCGLEGHGEHPTTTTELPPDVLAVLRDPAFTFPGEGGAINAVLARGCKACLGSEHPYWHPSDRPCPTSALTPAPAVVQQTPRVASVEETPADAVSNAGRSVEESAPKKGAASTPDAATLALSGNVPPPPTEVSATPPCGNPRCILKPSHTFKSPPVPCRDPGAPASPVEAPPPAPTCAHPPCDGTPLVDGYCAEHQKAAVAPVPGGAGAFDMEAEARAVVHALRNFICGKLAGPDNTQHWDICNDDTVTLVVFGRRAFAAGQATHDASAEGVLLERAAALLSHFTTVEFFMERHAWFAAYRALPAPGGSK